MRRREKSDFSVSAVIATYNRPNTLLVAIESIARQTLPVNEIIVVGDNCDDRTLKVVESFSDLNIRFINLPVRCGEQAIPNAIGTLKATSEYVAYLNHDDAWLPNHIELGLESIKGSKFNWFIGSALFSYETVESRPWQMPVFSDRSIANRKVSKSFSKSFVYLEPVSSWILSRADALAAGNWQPASSCRRTPLADFALRLWKTVGDICANNQPTVIKLLNLDTRGFRYEAASPEHDYLLQLMRNSADFWSKELTLIDGRKVERNAGVEVDWHSFGKFKQRLLGLGGLPLFARLYQITGFDSIEFLLRVFGAARGHHLSDMLSSRTGEKNLTKLSTKQVLEIMDKI